MFNFFKQPRPDFSKADISLTDFVIHKGKETFGTVHAIFTEYPGDMAKKYKWVDTYEEYMILADLEFTRRFPDHDFSKNFWKKLKFPDEEILMVAQGKKKLSVKRTKKEVTISIN